MDSVGGAFACLAFERKLRLGREDHCALAVLLSSNLTLDARLKNLPITTFQIESSYERINRIHSTTDKGTQ
jgi:hypothetical protein